VGEWEEEEGRPMSMEEKEEGAKLEGRTDMGEELGKYSIVILRRLAWTNEES
jgi:hypothetical protein